MTIPDTATRPTKADSVRDMALAAIVLLLPVAVVYGMAFLCWIIVRRIYL